MFRGTRITQRIEHLNLAFEELAESSSAYTRSGRRYHGIFKGRRFDAYITQVRKDHAKLKGGAYAGEHLEIVLDSNMSVRFKAGSYDQRMAKIGDNLKGKLISLKEEAPAGMIAYAHEAEWGHRILRDEQATSLMLELITPHDHGELRNLSLWPGAAMLSLHRLDPANITTENINHWLIGLVNWLERLESLPPPKRQAGGSIWDRMLRGNRKMISYIATIILLLFLLLVAVLILGVVWLLIAY